MSGDDEAQRAAKLPDIPWVEAADTPWGVRALDVRPVTLGTLSASGDPRCAENLASMGREDGLAFAGVPPVNPRAAPGGLRYRIDRALADGVLFAPREMEHKWGLYFHRGEVLCVRSWTREVHAVAAVRCDGDVAEVTAVRGVLAQRDEDPAFTLRALDFLIRTHALGLAHPAPLPAGLEASPKSAATWCMSVFGNFAHFATAETVATEPPPRLLRTQSLLHVAVARGDAAAAASLLDAGMPIDLLAADGLAPLHWALVRSDAAMLTFLLDRGSPVDVRSAQGATPLMNAVQSRRPDLVGLLINRGADPNAADHRGFTALHRAAEMGLLDVAEHLCDRGAAPGREAQGGHTPRSLAAARGASAVVALLDRYE
jgi:hypothetical protein